MVTDKQQETLIMVRIKIPNEFAEYAVENHALNTMARDMYSAIKDNNNIPKDIRDAWLDLCVVTTDIENLCNF